MTHTPVLLQESIRGLDIHEGDVFVDATLGNGGHSLAIAESFGKRVLIVGIDRDSDAIKRSKERFSKIEANIIFVENSFCNIAQILEEKGLRANKVLFDLGMSSNQLEESGRGFSFRRDEPLLMTFEKPSEKEILTAYEIVNYWKEDEIIKILYEYGEESRAKKIAKAIVERRKWKKIETSGELKELVEGVVAYKGGKKINPATKTFQAIRIAVNDELRVLNEGLEGAFGRLVNKGRIVVISFHSLEDRIVKNFYKEKAKNEMATIITKKPIIASREETEENPRARSAKMRILEKTK
ncbi:MAG: 16S rRNA (cytosine(1402)-N(4))-methyltransferase [Candidatus Zambryskibacteria bacterium CG_4_9_14_3_um_filter_40_16]|uniref:Ribosomal RNA small subunit methyltransferase H n=2 Tax=Candidatus Zambryskiibacteriota TaxID=1817925 RepID=A0A2H0K791_9BACT|nr:MAG: 16S rRNA (cytosine(1402)-N(4))-methyltransferase [Candidatus Zambryskibacteria bacterium CG11_big_fil_rev_8_21_14_0_20_40_24]PJA34000.1 MAG: 16S rRNA (cytosine(1402)-N(4))-methyltransferase [Candidatus Zambryskibacteria bacterium CG_4_9_14_3_um_filter_40_16]